MTIAVLPVIVNISAAIGALLLGAALIVLSPWLLNRRSRSKGAFAPPQSVLARWLKILVADVIACTLLFSGAHSFGLFSTLQLEMNVESSYGKGCTIGSPWLITTLVFINPSH